MNGHLFFLALLFSYSLAATTPTTATFVFISDFRYDNSSNYDYITNELIPALKPLTFNYLVLTGYFSTFFENGTPLDTAAANTASLDTLAKIFTQIVTSTSVKKIYWIPGDLDGASAFQTSNVTAFDENLHNKTVLLKSGLQLAGFGGSAYYGLFTDGQIGADLAILYNDKINFTASTILLTYGGPAGFSTTSQKSASLSIDQPGVFWPQSNWTETGTQSLTDFLSDSSTQQTTILNVHGNNPQGVGEATFGTTKIINPGSALYTNTLVLVQTIINHDGKWVLNNWKFYRYGNITLPGTKFVTTIPATCTITTTTVAAPLTTELYSQISIGLYTVFTGIVIVLVALWVFFKSKLFSETA